MVRKKWKDKIQKARKEEKGKSKRLFSEGKKSKISRRPAKKIPELMPENYKEAKNLLILKSIRGKSEKEALQKLKEGKYESATEARYRAELKEEAGWRKESEEALEKLQKGEYESAEEAVNARELKSFAKDGNKKAEETLRKLEKGEYENAVEANEAFTLKKRAEENESYKKALEMLEKGEMSATEARMFGRLKDLAEKDYHTAKKELEKLEKGERESVEEAYNARAVKKGGWGRKSRELKDKYEKALEGKISTKEEAEKEIKKEIKEAERKI